MTASKPLIAGNWKMHGQQADLAQVTMIAAGLAEGDAECDALLCLPATLIASAAALTQGGRLTIGGQDCHDQPAGAFTGDISASMLRDAGARAVILGHSERRSGHGETSASVRAKAKAAHDAGLTAIICVGETRGEREFGLAETICRRQIRESLPAGASAANTVIAYEPVWAIGTGLVPGVEDIAAIHAAIRSALHEAEAGDAAQPWRILYGGSVKPESAGGILRLEQVDGVLAGGASLKAEDFLRIAAASNSKRRHWS